MIVLSSEQRWLYCGLRRALMMILPLIWADQCSLYCTYDVIKLEQRSFWDLTVASIAGIFPAKLLSMRTRELAWPLTFTCSDPVFIVGMMKFIAGAMCVVGILAFLLTELSTGKRPPNATEQSRQAIKFLCSCSCNWVVDCVWSVLAYAGPFF